MNVPTAIGDCAGCGDNVFDYGPGTPPSLRYLTAPGARWHRRCFLTSGRRVEVLSEGSWAAGRRGRIESANPGEHIIVRLDNGDVYPAFALELGPPIPRPAEYSSVPWLGDRVVQPVTGVIVRLSADLALVRCDRTAPIRGPWSFLTRDIELPVVEPVPYRLLVRG